MATTRRRWSITLGVGLLVVATAAPVRAAGDGDYWNDRLDARPTDFIFGYGSLISSDSREETVGGQPWPCRCGSRPSSAMSVPGTTDRPPASRRWVCARSALARPVARSTAWSIRSTAATWPSSTIARPATIASRSRRRMLQPVSWLAVPSEGRIWMYVPTGQRRRRGRQADPADCAYPILQSYVDVVVTGGLEYGPDFAAEILETTEGWSPYWLDDRRLGRRPWVFEREWREIDALLAAHPAERRHTAAAPAAGALCGTVRCRCELHGRRVAGLARPGDDATRHSAPTPHDRHTP